MINWAIEPISKGDVKRTLEKVLSGVESTVKSPYTAVYGKGTLIRYIDMPKMSLEELKKCYVFSGCYCDADKLEKLKSEYYGPIYQYWDYEKIIKYDQMRRKDFDKLYYEKRAKKNLIKKVKELSIKVKNLKKGNL